MDASLLLQNLEKISFEINGCGRVSQHISISPAAPPAQGSSIQRASNEKEELPLKAIDPLGEPGELVRMGGSQSETWNILMVPRRTDQGFYGKRLTYRRPNLKDIPF
jgi:hypothetical protein